MKARLIVCALALVGYGAAAADPSSAVPETESSAPDNDIAYRLALSLNAEGKTKEALPILESLLQRFPGVLRYRFAYIVAAASIGDDDRALAGIDNDDLEAQAPYQVLKVLFRSALALEDEAKAERFHDLITMNSGLDNDSSLQLIQLYLKHGKSDKALALSRDLLERFPQRPEVLNLMGYVLRSTGHPTEALIVYQEILRLFPDNREAPKAITMILAELGGADESLRTRERYSVSMSTDELLGLETDRAAQFIRWSPGDRNTPTERFKSVDQAIAILTAAQERALTLKASAATLARIRGDLVVAYHARNLWKQAVAEYELLVASGEAVPEYVGLSAGLSYGKLSRYAESESILRVLAQRNSDSYEIHLPWFYALSDLERYDEAQVVIDALVARLAQADRSNPVKASAYTTALVAQGMLPAYRQQFADADHKLDAVLGDAPNSQEGVEAVGSLSMWRGHPRTAEDFFRIVLAEEPERVESRIGLANARMDRGDAAFFRQTVDELGPAYPEQRDVREAQRRLELHDRRYVIGSFTLGGDQYSIQGNRTREFDFKAYSAPFSNDRWRALAHYRSFWSGPVVATSAESGSAGLKYAATDWTAEVEAGSAGYARLEASRGFSDYWSGDLALEKNVFFRQARAVETGVTADQASLDLRWRQDATRDVSGGYRATRFSDDRRAEAYVAASQRFLVDFNRRLTASVRLSGQRNSNPDVAFFAPSRLLEASGTLSFDFMQWRDIETKKSSLWHRIWATAGRVDQSGFGSHAMSSIGYSQDIALSDAFRVRWSIAKTRYPFDGVTSAYYMGNISFEGWF